MMIPKPEPAVSKVLQSYPQTIRPKILALRKLIFETAAHTDGVGPLTECLKWGEPAYLTTKTKSGSTIRLGWRPATPDCYAVYFHCGTNLVETFRTLFPNDFTFQGNRAIVFEKTETVATDALALCIEAALTYHLRKRCRNETGSHDRAPITD